MSILIALLVFGLLIFIHEAGHFFVAKKCGVGILEFSIGMGPKLLSRKGKDGTVYSLRLLPIGGFVSMYGEDEDVSVPSDPKDGEGEPEAPAFPPEAAFSAQKTWKKILITVAGAVVNLIFGFVLMVVLTATQTTFGSNVVAEVTPVVGQVTKDTLQVGDEILSVNGHGVHIGQDLFYRLLLEGTGEMEIEVKRNGEKQLLYVTFPTDAENPGFAQLNFKIYAEKRSFPVVMKQAYYSCVSTVTVVIESLTGLVTGRFGVSDMSGPVGITGELGKAATYGLSSLLSMVVMISVNLGVFNLLPIPALDGGRLLFLLIELIRRKPMNPKYEGYIHAVGFLLLLILVAFVTCQDISRLVGA